MRISDDRYSRDRRRYELAWRLIEHGARTSTIIRWAGLSEYRIRRLFREYGRGGSGPTVYRLRGIPPHTLAFFWRTAALQCEAAVFAGICHGLRVLPKRSKTDAGLIPSVERGERLCNAFEAFRAHYPESQITIEYAVLLVAGLAAGEEVVLGECMNCARAILIDRFGPASQHCTDCGPERGAKPGTAGTKPVGLDPSTSAPGR